MDQRLPDLDLGENDREFLNNIQRHLPVLADIMRADVLVYCLTPSRDCAVILADAKPRTVPPIYPEPMLARQVAEEDEPAVFRALTRGRHEQRLNRAIVRGSPTVQDVFPIFHDNKIIAGLGIETTQVEQERLRRRNVVFRKALTQLREMLLRGRFQGGSCISALGEHDGYLVVDSAGRILYINSVAENLYGKLGYSGPFVNMNVSDLSTDESVYFNALESGLCVEQLVEEGSVTWMKKAIPLVVSSKPSWWSRLRSKNFEIDGVLLVIHDVTEERRKERELLIKSAMIREVHHRVKNNLQTIAALLRLQARRVSSEDAVELLNQSISRILSVAVVHEFLSHDELSIIDIREVCQRIIKEVTQGILDPEKRIRISLEGQSVFLPSQQATSCALIVNELLQNAVEHGFSTKIDGNVIVRLQDLGNNLEIEIADDGQGLGQGFRMGHDSSLGLQIVQTLAKEDLKGHFELINGDGARAVVTFPKLWRGSGIPWTAVE